MSASVLQELISEEGDVPLGFPVIEREKRVSPEHRNSVSFNTVSESSGSFLRKYFPEASFREWNDWKWQIRNSFTDIPQLSRIIELSDWEMQALVIEAGQLPLRVTPYYASLMNRPGDGAMIRKAMVPSMSELYHSLGEHADPLDEQSSSPVPHLVHRYPDRVLFLATDFCSAYCRYCTRSHIVAKENKYSRGGWEQAFQYIRENAEIRDVLISGGDPLTLSDRLLKELLTGLRSIPHVEIIRIGTKVPVVLPQRITPALAGMLKQFHPLMMSIHFMHPAELTPETEEACTRLANAGIPLGSQTVLLKGINDEVDIMKKLVQGLLRMRVRPYYLYQCDPIPGSAHFRTPVQKGIDIIHGLRGFTSGYGVPHFVIDAPGGGGKIPLLPAYYQGREGQQVVLKNYEGKIYYYPDVE